MYAPIAQLRGKVHLTGGMLTPVDGKHCMLTVGTDSAAFRFITCRYLRLRLHGARSTRRYPAPGAIQHAAALAERYQRAACHMTDLS